MQVAEQPFGGEHRRVLRQALTVHEQVLPVHVDGDVVDALAAQRVDHVQRHPDVPHQDLHRRLRVLVLEEDGDAMLLRVLRGLADAVDEAGPRLLVRRLERVVVAFDSGPDDHVRAGLGGEVDRLARQPERLCPRRVVRGDEAAQLEARVEVQAAGDAVDPMPVECVPHVLEVLR